MIVFRADANEILGTGHVMRCLSIARAFAKAGREVIFVTSDHKADKLILENGFSSICLRCSWCDMESDGIHGMLEQHRPELVIVDSYCISEQYMRNLSRKVKTVYIDDLNAGTWDVDYLINYNVFGTKINYTNYADTRTKLILGMSYAPLREEFCNIGEHIIKGVNDVLVSAGGADPEKVTENIMLNTCPKWKGICFHFVVGALNPRIDDIRTLANNTENVVLHINEKDMAGLMRKCDMAVSAAGSTLYELCACGTPTICYTLADNQLLLADGFAEKGVMAYAGDCRGNGRFFDEIGNKLTELINDSNVREKLSKKMQSLVDGKGAERIVESLGVRCYHVGACYQRGQAKVNFITHCISDNNTMCQKTIFSMPCP